MEKKRRYGFGYKIYRRVRYLRYVRKMRRQERKTLRLAQRREKKEIRRKAREQHLAMRQEEKMRRKEMKASILEEKQFLENQVPEENLNNPELENIARMQEALFLEERRKKKEETKRYRRILLKLIKRRILAFFRSLNRENFKKWVDEFQEARTIRKELLIISLNSTGMFLMSFLVIFFLSQLAAAISATFFGFSTTLSYDENYYLVERDEWYSDPVKLIFSANPVMALFLGLVALIIFSRIRNHPEFIKLFFFWAYMHGILLFFGGLLIGTLFSMGFGHVVIWSYIMDTGKLIYSIVALVVMVVAGLLSTRSVLITANTYYRQLDRSNRRRFVMGQVLLPYLAGNLVLFIFWLPRMSLYYQLIELSFLVILIAILSKYSAHNDLYFEDEEKKVTLYWAPLLITLGLLILIRLVLGIGITIG